MACDRERQILALAVTGLANRQIAAQLHLTESTVQTHLSATADLSDHLTRLVYELLDAHDDTARLVEGAAEDERWDAHLAYLRDLQRVARELLASATAEDGARASLASARH